MKKNNNLLDEMQEMKVLKAESFGFKMAFWGLLGIYLGQSVLDCEFKQYAPEMILFFVLCIYSIVISIKNSVWDRKYKPDTKTNLLLSIVSSLLFGVIMGIKVYMKYPDKIVGSIATAVVFTVMIFAACFIVLTVLAIIYNKKVAKEEAMLDKEEAEE